MGTAEVAGQRTDVETWWRDAVVYQLYIRSFADGNGDGIGDIAGIRARLGHLRDLGVDAVWINPWYPSPMADGGYDVADYRAVEPMFGTGDEAAALVDEAHALGLRVILDIVPNHSSDQHAWFREALAAAPGSPERGRYHFRPGRGPGGDEPPNDWRSVFGGPAWSRVTDDGRPGEWYLHLFDAAQPDFNWSDPRVQEEFESILRFWFDRGVDGFRIDVAHGLVKSDGLPDVGHDEQSMLGPVDRGNHPHWDRDGVHDIFRAWRRVADSYAEPRVFVGEAWVDSPERLARYLRSDELHTAFNFDFLRAPWDAPSLRRAIDHSLETVAAVGAAATWVLSNHDVVRHVSRLGRPATNGAGHSLTDLAPAVAFDRELGRRRARAAALLMFALPGGAYVYQGDELGLWEVEDLPDEVLQDPTWSRSGHTDRGRDGCRVPLPWSGTTPPFGFSPAGAHAVPWLPQPADFAAVTVEAQMDDPESMLSLYRAALTLRHEHPALGDGPFTWLPSEPGVLAFSRGAGFACVVNLSDGPAQLPVGGSVLLGSGTDAGDGMLPPDAAVWLAV
ncbi:glycoside hydrolase family 13 protein [Pseudonocardia sp. CA-142604]|uniref:glycoside hydrolase family 13 protein n=1 Tax=Pseudonocardia sp. CA-142604 TaxID=3240024 RepID=UPI003D8CA79B